MPQTFQLRLHREGFDQATPNRSAFDSQHRTAAHGPGEALNRAQRRRVLAAFESGDGALRGAHALGHLRLRQAGLGTRGHQFAGGLEFGRLGIEFRAGRGRSEERRVGKECCG